MWEGHVQRISFGYMCAGVGIWLICASEAGVERDTHRDKARRHFGLWCVRGACVYMTEGINFSRGGTSGGRGGVLFVIDAVSHVILTRDLADV